MSAPAEPFWRVKSLDEMSSAEWESLCDGCGRCCMVKLQDEDTGAVRYTDVGCRLLDGTTCRCRNYEGRQAEVPDCLRLTPDAVRNLTWLPRTCAYRQVAEGRPLESWHPLVSGDPRSVHAAGISVQGCVAGPEDAFTLDELMDRVLGEAPDRPPGRKRTEPRRRRTR